jgi:hypothetical protein
VKCKPSFCEAREEGLKVGDLTCEVQRFDMIVERFGASLLQQVFLFSDLL